MDSKQPTTGKRNRRRLFKVVTVLFGLLLAVLCAEAGLRIHVARRGWTANCYVTGLVFFVPDESAGYTLRPGLRLRSSAYDLTVNSMGLRGVEVDAAKPEGTWRIAVLGGSSVFGYLVPDGQDSCCELQRILRDQNVPVEVLNAGVPGYNMRQCRLRFEQQIARLSPDMVILYLGWNDIRFLISENPGTLNKTPPAPSLFRRVLAHSVFYGFLSHRLFPSAAPRFAPPRSAGTAVTKAGAAGFDEDLRELIHSIRSQGAVPVLSTQLSAGNQGCTGLDEFLGSTEDQLQANRRISQWIAEKIRSTAESEGLLLIDCAKELPCDPRMLGDAIHLTHEGHRRVAALWAKALLPKLTPEASEAGRQP